MKIIYTDKDDIDIDDLIKEVGKRLAYKDLAYFANMELILEIGGGNTWDIDIGFSGLLWKDHDVTFSFGVKEEEILQTGMPSKINIMSFLNKLKKIRTNEIL